MAEEQRSEAPSSSPSISIRQWIRWLPERETEEPLSTVVLTTSKNNYVDTRVILPEDIKDVTVISSSDVFPLFDLSHLQWAFAGTSSSIIRTRRSSGTSNSSKNAVVKPLTPTDEKREEKDKASTHSRSASGGSKLQTVRECTWTHWVDSRGPVLKETHSDTRVASGTQQPQSPATPDGWTDTGTIYPTEKENESLEKGKMHNDAGVLQDMEELWRDFRPQQLPGENKSVAIVLQAENKIFGTKGMVIRIGGWCQGVIRSANGEIGVERWRFGSGGVFDGLVKRYDDSSCLQEGKWQRIFKIGKMSLPCESACLKSDSWKEGESIVHGALEWKIIEKELL